MRTAPLAFSAISLLAIATSGCEKPLPPEARGGIVVPPGPQATGAGAPLVAPTHPYETSAATQPEQRQSGYFAAAGEPLVAETTNYAAPPHYVDRASMRDVLVASNPAVYSNRLLMTRPNLYEDPASYHAWVASVAASQTMSGATSPPAQTASATHDYAVYFDWNQSTLTPEGQQVVDQLANQARQSPGAQIGLVGKADRSGSDPYNMALSQRRAEAVRDRLVAEGIAADRIESRWVGEREPPVPTANGVREPRNRVVDLTMTTMVGSSAPPRPIALPRRVLFTSTENYPPGGSSQELPGAVANGSVTGQAGASP
jgi:outer membrane protein OmpA-like peptidoglycan-associated protein